MISLFGKPEPVEPSLLDKLKATVSKTKAALSETVDTIFQGQRKIDPALLKQLETALLSADLGVATTKEILASIREKLDRSALSDASQLKREIKSHIVRILNAAPPLGFCNAFDQRHCHPRDLHCRRQRRGQNHQHRQTSQPPQTGGPQRGPLRR